MREDIVHGCLDVIRPCVDLSEGIGATDAEPHDATRRVHANDVGRGRYGPYWKPGLRSLFLE